MPPRSKPLLSLAGDERLVEHIRRGNEAAFEVAYERHGPGILSFCRHMLGAREEAEDALQQTFVSAYRDLLRDDRPIKLKPWLYTIARNRCLSMLRARRDEVAGEYDVPTAGLDEQVQRRAELRELLHDLHDLPEEQRAALLLSEVSDLSHAEVATIIGCEVAKVKALVFRARAGLIERRGARATPCQAIREQLATLRGGSLRRGVLRHHLRSCSGCRTFREQVRRQRAMLAVVLPVTPSMGLKTSLLSAAGIGAGQAGGGAAAGGLGAGAAAGGLGAGTAAVPAGIATIAKVAAVALVVGGGAAAGKAALDHGGTHHRAPAAPAHRPPRPAAGGDDASPAGVDGASPALPLGRELRRAGRAAGSKAGRHGRGKPGAHGGGRGPASVPGSRGHDRTRGRGPASVPGGRGRGGERRSPTAKGAPRGRGAPAVPPTPHVRRGPPQPRTDRGVRARGDPPERARPPKRPPEEVPPPSPYD